MNGNKEMMYSNYFHTVLRILVILFCISIFNANATKRSFILGINAYDNLPGYSQLKRPINDATAISRVFNDSDKLGYEGILHKNLNRSEFNEAWQNFIDEVEAGDTVVIFIAGHGVELEGENYILPRDVPYIAHGGRQKQLKRESIRVNELLLDIKDKKPAVTLLILDACRENPLIPREFRGSGTNSGLVSIEPPEGVFIMYSAGSHESALDRLPENDNSELSIYTRHLVPLLEEPGLEIQEIARIVRTRVSKLARTHDHTQRPAYYDGLLGNFCLGGCVAANKKTIHTENLVIINQDNKYSEADKSRGEIYVELFDQWSCKYQTNEILSNGGRVTNDTNIRISSKYNKDEKTIILNTLTDTVYDYYRKNGDWSNGYIKETVDVTEIDIDKFNAISFAANSVNKHNAIITCDEECASVNVTEKKTKKKESRDDRVTSEKFQYNIGIYHFNLCTVPNVRKQQKKYNELIARSES